MTIITSHAENITPTNQDKSMFFILLIIRIFICNTTVGLIDLSVKEVAKFMRKLGINEEYVESAEDMEVNGASISNLPDRQLKHLLGMKKNPMVFLQFKFSVKREFGVQAISPLDVKCLPHQTVESCHLFEVRIYGILQNVLCINV